MINKSLNSRICLRRKKCFRTAVTILTTISLNAVAGSETAGRQIETSVRQRAQAEIGELARQQGWMRYNTTLNAVLPPEAQTLPRCQTPPTTVPSTPGKRSLQRLRYTVTCTASSGWSITATVKPTLTLPVAVATQAFERGDTFDETATTLRVENIVPLSSGFFTASKTLAGQTVKRRIAAGQIITPALLEQPVMVERGQQVVMMASQQGVEASTAGEALKRGRKGEVIRVRNLRSQRIVDAVVDAAGVVRIVTPLRE